MRKKLLLCFCLCLLLNGCSSASSEIILEDYGDKVQSAAYLSSSDDSTEAFSSVSLILVYVCGAVENPGVYEFETGDRICDAIQAAGGFSEEADTEYLNLAAMLQDGIKLQVPTVAETENYVGNEPDAVIFGTISGDMAAGNDPDLININTASLDILKTLPGIGDGIATRIIEYRNNNGNFKKIEDIKKVSGIKDKLFDKIKEYITV